MTTAADVLKLIKERRSSSSTFLHRYPWQGSTSRRRPRSSRRTSSVGHAFDGSSIAGWKGIRLPTCCSCRIDELLRRPVHGRDDALHHVRCHRAHGRQGLRTRSAVAREARRGLPEIHRARRGRLLRSGARVLHLRFRRVVSRHVGKLLQDLLGRGAVVDGREVRRRQHGPSATGQGGYFPVPPVDSLQDIRSAICLAWSRWESGQVHHHEVAAAGRTRSARSSRRWSARRLTTAQSTRSTTTAHAYGKTATFMRSRSSATTAQACTCTSRCGRTARTCSRATATPGLSEFALYYIGGVIKHAKALNAITSPGTNSYKR